MEKIFNKKSIVLISILLIVFYFSLSSFVSASTISSLDDSEINYQIDMSTYSTVQSALDKFKKSDYYKNSNYYYFCGYEWWHRQAFVFLIDKTLVSSSTLSMLISDVDLDNQSFVIDFGERDIKDQFIVFDGNADGICYNYDIDNHTTFKFAGMFNKEKNTFYIPFDTNFPKITKTRSDGKTFDFFVGTPLLAPIVQKVEMSQVVAEIVGLLPLAIGLLVSVIGLKKALQDLQNRLRAS